jgi:GTPase
VTEIPFKAGFAAIVGKPNAGKSTLLNRLLGMKLSIVSSKPQTTRNNLLGILNGPGHQICFLDTPGLIVAPKDKLQAALSHNARNAARRDADVIVLLVDPETPPPEDLEALRGLKEEGKPLILAINKVDVSKPEARGAARKAYEEALAPDATFEISAMGGSNVPKLLEEIVRRLPESPPLYDDDRLSDRWERFFVAEIVREKIFESFTHEVPHACAVVIESFVEEEGRKDLIRATIYVEKPSQKPILIGKAGRAIRDLGTAARQDIEKFLGRAVHLELRVDVKHNWRRDPQAVKELGYTS